MNPFLIFIFTFVFNVSANTSTMILDVRTPDEFSVEHAKGAINIDVTNESFDKKVSTLDKNQEYAVYCKAGGRAAKAVEKMKALGFKKIKNIETVDAAIKKFGKE